jgi:hypothetical protein
MSLIWMPPATTTPPFLHRLEGDRNQRANGREDDRGVEFLRWPFHRASGPDGTEHPCKRLRLVVAFAGEGIDLPSSMLRDLSDDVSGGTEP